MRGMHVSLSLSLPRTVHSPQSPFGESFEAQSLSWTVTSGLALGSPIQNAGWNFPGGPVVKDSMLPVQDLGLDPLLGTKIPHVVQCSQKIKKKKSLTYECFRGERSRTFGDS